MQPQGHQVEFRLCLRERYARLEPAHDAQIVVIMIGKLLGRVGRRNPDVALVEKRIEPARHDPEHGVVHAIHLQCPANDGGIGLDPAQWPTVWFKGGSEPGVLTLGYLATNSKGQTFVVVAMLANLAAALPPQAIVVLQGIVRSAFELAG